MRFFKKAMDPVSSETHFIGAVLSLATLVMMIIIAIIEGSDHLTIIGIIVFGLSSIALYSASCLYHYYNANEDNKIKLILRKLDHSMIYVLIAGTYTPICLSYLEYPHSIYFLAAIFDLPAFSKVPLGCLGLIACGGISYTIGAIVYIVKKPNWFKTFGFHELFHIFVMIGSAFHFLAVIIYILL